MTKHPNDLPMPTPGAAAVQKHREKPYAAPRAWKETEAALENLRIDGDTNLAILLTYLERARDALDVGRPERARALITQAVQTISTLRTTT